MNGEDMWAISGTIGGREPRLPGPGVGNAEFFEAA